MRMRMRNCSEESDLLRGKGKARVHNFNRMFFHLLRRQLSIE